jgi:Transposase and inactivated derivatives
MEKHEDTPTIESLQQQIIELSAKLKWYEEQFRLAQNKRFSSSSEQTHQDQLELSLFNEAEMLATTLDEEQRSEQITYERRKSSGKRSEDLSKLPVETITYSLEEGEQICTCCGGSLHEMSTETRNEIAVVPPQVKVIRHVRNVYACRRCEREDIQTPIVTAAMPKPVYPGSLASPSSMAYIMRKYDEALKAAPPATRSNKDSLASQGLAYCNALFCIERELKDASPEERYAMREKRSLPIL